MIKELDKNRVRLEVPIVEPGNKAIPVGAKAVTHEVTLKEFPFPEVALLCDDTTFDFLDERSEEGFAHFRRKRIRGPLAESRTRKLTQGGVFPFLLRIIQQRSKASSGQVLRNRQTGEFAKRWINIDQFNEGVGVNFWWLR